jgi:hypothetical protein
VENPILRRSAEHTFNQIGEGTDLAIGHFSGLHGNGVAR